MRNPTRAGSPSSMRVDALRSNPSAACTVGRTMRMLGLARLHCLSARISWKRGDSFFRPYDTREVMRGSLTKLPEIAVTAFHSTSFRLPPSLFPSSSQRGENCGQCAAVCSSSLYPLALLRCSPWVLRVVFNHKVRCWLAFSQLQRQSRTPTFRIGLRTRLNNIS